MNVPPQLMLCLNKKHEDRYLHILGNHTLVIDY